MTTSLLSNKLSNSLDSLTTLKAASSNAGFILDGVKPTNNDDQRSETASQTNQIDSGSNPNYEPVKSPNKLIG